MMQSRKINPLLLILIFTFFASCKEKKIETEENSPVKLNRESIEIFAGYLENSVILNNPDPFNRAFDKDYIRKQISDNSIVYSSLDTDFGQAFFESNFRQGDKSVDVVNRGGDFKFVKYYEKEGKHHVIFRHYRDHALKIDDYIVDTLQGEIKIRDGFGYSVSTTFVNQVRYNMLFDIMQRTNPEGSTQYFNQIRELLQNRKGEEALRILETNREFLEEYPLFIQYYLQSLMQVDPDNFMENIDQLERDGRLDPRSLLLHKFLYCVNMGKIEEVERTAMELIRFTGDDPIYLFMFGLAYFYAQDYDAALYCYENALTGMPMIWDLWYNTLECYQRLNAMEKFDEILLKGKDLYGLNDSELEEIKNGIIK